MYDAAALSWAAYIQWLPISSDRLVNQNCSFFHIWETKAVGVAQLLLCRSSLVLVCLEIILDRNFVLFKEI